MPRLETNSPDQLISLGFMQLYQCRLTILCGNGSPRAYAGPIEDVQVVQAAFRLQQVTAPHWSLEHNWRGPRKQRHSRPVLAEVHNVVGPYHLMFLYAIHNIHTMRIALDFLYSGLHFDVQIPTVQVCR